MVKEHHVVFGGLEELVYIDPDKILPQHQRLLMVDTAELKDGLLANKQVWIPKTEATSLAKENKNEAGIRGG